MKKKDVSRLSVAMIVKDEEDNISDCLRNIKTFADEICIVDTGSTDNTVEILRTAQVKWTRIIWPDNFATARNESLRLCTGRWIFIMDADERISAEDAQKLRELVQSEPVSAYRLWTKNYTYNTFRADFQPIKSNDEPFAMGYPGWFPSAKVRLFPNRSEIFFHGAVHESVLPSLLQLNIPVIDCEDICVHHYGERRNPERIRKKQLQYISLGLKKIENDPDNPQSFAELAAQLAETGNYPEALEFYRQALDKDPNCADYWGEVGALLFLLGFTKEAEQSLRLALRMNPTLFPVWKNLAIVCMKTENWQYAIKALQKCLELRPNDVEIQNAINFVLTTLNVSACDEPTHLIVQNVKREEANAEQSTYQVDENNTQEDVIR